jgi:2,3-bisphosphoglycerate-independent phosphoglycerate mutase
MQREARPLKSIILLGDGMADEPIGELGGKTPLEVARTPFMDSLASRGELGMARTVKHGFPPGSDVANMTVLGIDPGLYYTGRAPIEATSIGVSLKEDDTAFRINLVNLAMGDEGLSMGDYSAGHISTGEARELIKAIQGLVGSYPNIQVYPGVEYRHLMVINGYDCPALKATPPHDITGQGIEGYLPDDPLLRELMEKSREVLKDHPVNVARRKAGKKEATSIWPWGQGKGMKVPTLKAEYGITGSMISAVDLLKGLGILRGMDVINVPGATGWIDTDYLGKASAAVASLSSHDLAFVHVEAPDEAGHGGLIKEKIRAIEDFDEKVVGHVLRSMEAGGEPFRILVMPDHPTPIARKTHTPDPVPFVICSSSDRGKSGLAFTENEARKAGLFIEEGHTLLARLLARQ